MMPCEILKKILYNFWAKPTKTIKYMTRKQIQQQISAFTGDWKTAARKAKVFDENCYVPLSQVKNIELSFGKYGDGHGNYYGENRNTLHFHYTTRDEEKYWFSILD